MLVSGAGFGWLAAEKNRADNQKNAIEELKALGCELYYDYEHAQGKAVAGVAAPTETWWRKQLGNDFFDKLIIVRRRSAKISDEQMVLLTAVRDLEELNLSGARISDEGLVNLRDLTKMKTLDLWGNDAITDKGLRHLASMRRLEQLWLGATEIRGTGLAHLRGMTSLRILHLSHTHVDDAAISRLQNCKNLETLTLFNTEVTDQCIEQLTQFPNLDYVILGNTKVTDAGLQRLRDALPHCTIIPN